MIRIVKYILLFFLISDCGSYSDNQTSVDSSTSPMITSITPLEDSNDISTNTDISVTFSESIKSSTVTTNTIRKLLQIPPKKWD